MQNNVNSNISWYEGHTITSLGKILTFSEFYIRQIMHVCACIQGQIMHDVWEEPLDIPHRGPQDRVRYIQVASRAQSALFRPTNAQATVHCLFYTTSPSYWAAPPKVNEYWNCRPILTFTLTLRSWPWLVSKKWSKKLQSNSNFSHSIESEMQHQQ